MKNNALTLDPSTVTTTSTEELVEAYVNAQAVKEDLEATSKVLRDELLLRIPDDGTVVNGYSLTKATRWSFSLPTKKDEKEVVMKELEELGATKLAVDNSVLKKLALKGIALPIEPNITVYPIIRSLEK